MKTIHTSMAPTPMGPYSQAVLRGGLLFVSGIIGVEPSSNQLVQGFEAQAQQVFRNIKEILEAAGMGMSKVVKVTIYATNLVMMPKLNEIYSEWISEPYPAREVIRVSSLPLDANIEISVIAVE